MPAQPRRGVPRPRRVDDEGRMTLAEHIRELRTRLIRAALAVAVGTIAAYVFYDPIFKVLERPYCRLPEARTGLGDSTACHLYFFHPLDAFAIRLRVAIIAGILLSAPVWLYQLWRFITPGLHRHERRWALTFAGCSAGLFALGSFLAYLTLDKALAFLLGAAGSNAQSLLGIDQYLSFTSSILGIFGLSFELPLLLVLLNFAGVLGYERLRSWLRPAAFLLFVFAAVVTPSQDPITMTVMGGGLTVLYAGAVVVAWAHDKRAARKQEALWAALDSDDPAAALLRKEREEQRGSTEPVS